MGAGEGYAYTGYGVTGTPTFSLKKNLVFANADSAEVRNKPLKSRTPTSTGADVFVNLFV